VVDSSGVVKEGVVCSGPSVVESSFFCL